MPTATRDALADALQRLCEPQSDLVARRLRARLRRDLLQRDTTPERIGRFTVLEAIGSGAMGAVFAAHDPELDRAIALKLVRSRSGEHREQALAEARALARLTDPHVVAVYDVGEFDDGIYLAMELVRGATLRSLLAAGRRPWRELRPIFAGAARGLAAAHAAGLVHRDFKPSNVLLGEAPTAGAATRVKVADFGLARALDRATHGGGTTSGGTLAYMAPEQLSGDVVDARADQFAFCVTLFEAVHGHRPFSGDDPTALAESIAAGPRWSARDVPRAIKRLVLRGLSPDPARRFATMDEIVAILQRRAPLVRRVTLVLAAGASAGIGYAWTRPDPPGPCEHAGTPIERVWNDDRVAALDRAAASAGSVAQLSWASGRGDADAWVARWSDARSEACRATFERRERSEHAFDLTAACLDRGAAELDALATALLEAPSSERWLHARTSIADLSDLARCGDTEALQRIETEDGDPRAQALRDGLARGNALLHLGEYDGATSVIDPLVAQARSIGDRVLLAEALYMAGDAAKVRWDVERAEQTMRDALWAAEATRHDYVAADAATALVEIVGAHQQRTDRALEWGEHARAINERLGIADGMTLRLSHALGDVEALRGRPMEAAGHAQWRLEHARQVGDPYWEALALGSLLSAHGQAGRSKEALAYGEQALAAARVVWSDVHPNVASMHNNLANVCFDAGDLDRSADHYARAIEIWSAVFGDDGVQPAMARMNLATVHGARGAWDRALVELDRALPVLREQLGDRHPQVATARTNYGDALAGLGRHDAAREQYAAALEILREHPGEPTDAVAYASLGLARVELALGRPALAVELLRPALADADRVELPARLCAELRIELASALRATHGDRAEIAALLRAATEHLDGAGLEAPELRTAIAELTTHE